MHGRVKVRSTAEQEELKRIERAAKLARYKAGINLIFSKRKNGVWDEEILFVTEEMVLKNPDIYTLWNIRREAFNEIKWSEDEHEIRLKKELTLTENCLRANPKSYSVWHQRCWVIDRQKNPDWSTELHLCAKCLNLDERNFHCWDYRQYVVKKAGVSEADEFKFSTVKIESNFSNYSSWHYRSLLLPKIFPDPNGEFPINKEHRAEELDLVMNATFTDPNDTSAWFYQRWLLNGKQSQTPALWRAKVCPSKIIVAFTRPVSLTRDTAWLKANESAIPIAWNSSTGQKYSTIWVADTPREAESWNSESIVGLTVSDTVHELTRSSSNDTWYFRSASSLDAKHDSEQLAAQLENYKQLADLEPNNKWVSLTGIILMKNIDPVKYHETIVKDLSLLRRVDKLRVNYYDDLSSKFSIEYVLRKIWREESENSVDISKLDLANADLTVLCDEQYLGFFEQIDLSGNRLEKSLRRLAALQSCVRLDLASNDLKSVKDFPTLPSLRYLSLRKNDLDDLNEVIELIERHDLDEIDLRDNPLSSRNDVTNKLNDVSSKLKISIIE